MTGPVDSWRYEFQIGKRYLRRHKNEQALRHFERALSGCPVSQKRELAQVLYFLGATLNKIGMRNCALKSWSTSGRLYKNGYAARCIVRFSNGYGMAKQRTSVEDDHKAFYSVQLARYLRTKRSKKIGTDAERDMIDDLIEDGWKMVKSGYRLDALSPEEKMTLFRSVRIIFPAFHVPDATERDHETIPVDFGRKQKISGEDHCFCGSGLPYRLCCGRLPGEEELLSGII